LHHRSLPLPARAQAWRIARGAAVARAVARLSRALAAACVRAWAARAAAASARAAAGRRVAARARRAALATAFAAWRAAVAAKAAGLAALRRCVARKRVAHAFFLRWCVRARRCAHAASLFTICPFRTPFPLSLSFILSLIFLRLGIGKRSTRTCTAW
jgi:hypothetical protein